MPLGAPRQASGGDTFSPSQVNSVGMGCPSANALLVNANAPAAGVVWVVVDPPVVPGVVVLLRLSSSSPPHPATTRATTTSDERTSLCMGPP